jgi:hypothetical protein
MLPAAPSLSIAHRSTQSRASWHNADKPEPAFLADAPTLAAHVARERLGNAVSAELRVSLAHACGLIEEARPHVAKLRLEDARHMQTAVMLRDVCDQLASLQSAGSTLRRTSAQRCRALSEELAASLVKSPGDLRAVAAYLLAHPQAQDS